MLVSLNQTLMIVFYSGKDAPYFDCELENNVKIIAY